MPVDKKGSVAETPLRVPLPMRILLDCRPLQLAGPDAERSRLIFSAVAELSASGGVEWLLIADHRYRRGLFPAVSGRVIIRRALPGRVGWRNWYGRQVRRVAEKEGVDMVWLTGGIAAGGIAVPVCLWMPERADPKRGVRRGYGSLYRSRLKTSLGIVAAVVCYSERDRVWLEGIGSEVKEKVRVLTAVTDESIGVITEEEKEKIKAERTQGKEYFLADLTGCGEEEVVNLLKAFSLFKKRQQTQMRLVLAGGIKAPERIGERLKTYKYRQDVDLDAADGKRPVPPGAAYAVLLPVEGNSLGTTLLCTWKAGVPVIAVNGGIFEEMAQGAVLGIAAGDPATLAGQMMRIYKEEDLRQELTRKGFERLKVYSRENFAQVLQVITEIAAC
jgi:glycosyltransferase involved in cell wall biosynthesis